MAPQSPRVRPRLAFWQNQDAEESSGRLAIEPTCCFPSVRGDSSVVRGKEPPLLRRGVHPPQGHGKCVDEIRHHQHPTHRRGGEPAKEETPQPAPLWEASRYSFAKFAGG